MQPVIPRIRSVRSSEEKQSNSEETLLLLQYKKNYDGAPFSTEIPHRQRQYSIVGVSLVLCLLVIGTTWRFFLLHRNVETFDYIVVGAGPAGIIVATKLARSFPKLSILLVEAGTHSQSSHDRVVNQFDVPLLWSGVASSDMYHWKISNTILGKGLGGSGLFNAMIYIRSLRSDWNISGWDYEDILNEYVELENFQPHRERTAFNNGTEAAHRGHRGPIVTSQPGLLDELAEAFVQAAKKSKLSYTSSFNEGHRKNTVGLYEFNIRQGVRDSVARAFLNERNVPPNLVIQTGATVTKVLLEQTSNTAKSTWAVGVEYVASNLKLSQGELRNKRGEVILSAGAISSPQVLWNSGIENQNIGRTLRDHPVVGLGFQLAPDVAMAAKSIYDAGFEMESYKSAVRKLLSNSVTKDTFLLNQVGIMGTAGFSAGAFLSSPWSTKNAPDIQVTVFPRHIEPHITKANNHMVPHAMLVTVALLDPEGSFQVYSNQSRSRLVENVQDIDDAEVTRRILGYRLPTIGLPPDRKAYLSQLDLKRLAWGIEQVRLIQQEYPLRNLTGPEIYPNLDGELLEQYIQANVLNNAHFAGSCRIGKVVDERLRVLGVDGLRVVDAGVLPKPTNGNIHSTVCAVASRAAKLIAEDRRTH